MAHDDVCPCKHGNHVCLVSCDLCAPDAFILNTRLWEAVKREYHRIAVDNERLRAVIRELERKKT